jgi:histidyl-tRNA synthetase
VVGSNSLLNEVELAAIYATVFERLQLPVEIRINSRKILAGLAELCGGQDLLIPITVAIDKLDKIGIEKVKEELLQRDLQQDQITVIEKYLQIDGANEAKIEQLKQLMGSNPTAIKGIEELEYMIAYHATKYSSKLVVDFTLARGLNYYTGLIFEIKAIGAQMGSIGGGGRYDDLTGLFGVPNVPGVGISFGVDRIYDVLEELKLFPETVQKGTKLLFFNLGIEESKTAFNLMQELRESGIPSELYHEQSKFDKQFKYAEKKQVPYVVIIGSTELAEGTCIVKNLETGEQQTILQQELNKQLF